MRQSLSVLFMFLIAFYSHAQSKWQEDTHYKVIAEKASASAKVVEVFSYWCPACNAFESIVPQVKRALPVDIPFEKVHVNFNGATSKDTQNDATAAMLAAKALKMDTQFNKAMFNTIHQQRKKIASKGDVIDVFAKAGGDTKKLEKMMKSFGLRSQIAKNDKIAKTVRSVPTVIVNDKYQAIFTRSMTPEEYVELVIWLTKQK